MGFYLHVELDCDKKLLPEFAGWCSRAMLYALAHAYEIHDGDPYRGPFSGDVGPAKPPGDSV
jgi:hypothetical protein